MKWFYNINKIPGEGAVDDVHCLFPIAVSHIAESELFHVRQLGLNVCSFLISKVRKTNGQLWFHGGGLVRAEPGSN